MNQNAYNIYNVLDKVRKRPGMYIGEETLENMSAYLAGYQTAMRDLEIKDIAEPKFYVLMQKKNNTVIKNYVNLEVIEILFM